MESALVARDQRFLLLRAPALDLGFTSAGGGEGVVLFLIDESRRRIELRCSTSRAGEVVLCALFQIRRGAGGRAFRI